MAEETIINFGEEFDKQEFGLIDDGKYEVEISKIEQKVSTKTGNKYLNFTFTIRKDVTNQKFGGRKLFYTISKKEGDACYDFGRINKIILTQKATSNYKARFIDFDEVLQYLHGIHLVITVETNFDDYRGEDRNEVKDFSFEPSIWDSSEHTPVAENEHKEVSPIDTEELPF